jgi:Trk K+ transport system NAD-binding subunit
VAEPASEETPDAPEGHVIICGSNALASRMAEELTARYGLAVTAIVPAAGSPAAARLAATPGVRVLERPELTTEAFLTAGLRDARSLAIVPQDDLGNFHAALRAREINPQIRLVIASFNEQRGNRIGAFFTNCSVLSQSQLAAPSLVAAALGKPAPSPVPMAGQTLYVASREVVGAGGHIVCGLAASADAEAPLLAPPADPAAGLVLAVADGTPRNPLSRRRQRRLTAPLRLTRRILWSKMGVAFAALVAVLVVGFALLDSLAGISPVNAFYLTFLDAAGAAVTDPSLPAAEKIAQFVLTFDGMAFLPLVTAAVVIARIPGSQEWAGPPPVNHVVVAGLGNTGTTMIQELHDLGFDVVGIDKNPDAAGIPLAHRLGIRAIIGAAHREETLADAGIASCQAFVSVTNDDIVNLEAALTAQALAPEARIVIRLYDDELAERLQATVQPDKADKIVSRSTSYLAAPMFAAAVLDHEVRSIIAVGRHVLLLAEVAADGSAALSGQRVSALHRPGLLRVIALVSRDSEAADWSPAPDRVISAADKVVVVATRAGLSGLLRGAAGADNPPDPQAEAGTASATTPGK